MHLLESVVKLTQSFQFQRAVDSMAREIWSYRVKVFDTTSKRTPRTVRELRNFTDQFTSMDHLRQVLFSELGDDLPSSYNIGYYEGRHHSKNWLTTDSDILAMNDKFPSRNVCLWCDTQTS